MFEDLFKGLSKELFSHRWWNEIQYLLVNTNNAMSNEHYDVVMSNLDILDHDLRMIANTAHDDGDMDKILTVCHRITSLRLRMYADICAIPEVRELFANKYSIQEAHNE